MITVSESEKSKRLPEFFMRIIQFYRFFGFSFVELNEERNKTLFSKIKNYLMIGYNIIIILYLIVTQIVIVPINGKIFVEDSKPLMRALFYAGAILSGVDMVFGYILSLIRGKKLLKLFKEDVSIIDNNTKSAQILFISKLIIISIIACAGSYIIMVAMSLESRSACLLVLKFVLGFIAISFFMIGTFFIAVFYSCITWIITSQINNLKNNISEGLYIFRYFRYSFQLNFEPHAF